MAQTQPPPGPFSGYFLPQQHGGLAEAAYQPALVPRQHGCHAAAAAAPRPPVPPTHAPQQQQQQPSQLTYSLQGGAHAAAPGQPSLMPAQARQAPPNPFFATAAAPQQGAAYAGGWQAAAYATALQQQAHAQQQHQQRGPKQPSAFGLAAGLAGAGGGLLGAQAAAACWPTLQPHAAPFELLHPHAAHNHAYAAHQQAVAAAQQQQQQVGAEAALLAAGGTSRRVRRRHPNARRSLLNLFDAAAISEEVSEDESEEEGSDSDCDMMQMCSQGSDLSTATAAFPGLFSTPSPATPHGGAHPGAPSPSPLALAGAQHARRGGCDSPADDGSLPPMAAGGVGTASEDHLLPLQHLLMSERGQHLSALEAKAIVYKVAADLAALHDGGVLHRHVTVASVALCRSGNLATARLMAHPYNVHTGQGRRYTGGKKAGVDAYLAPELARCPADCVAYTPAGDLWSLGVVLFVLLSGSHVPFGNRGLCWTSIPNMPGPQESVDKLQAWLEEHLACKLSVINQLKRNQDRGKAPVGAAPEMRVIGLDAQAADLLMRLLAADPAARLTARQVLSHPWLAEVECLMRAPAEAPGQNAAMRAASPEAPAPPAASPGFEARLDSAASDLACLGFSPATPCEQLAGPAWALLRRSSGLSAASSDCHWECPTGSGGCSSAGTSAATSAHTSCASLADMLPHQLDGRAAAAAAGVQPLPAQAASAAAAAAAAAALPPACSFLLGDGTCLQLLPEAACAALVAGGVIPELAACSTPALPYRPLGYAVQPVELAIQGHKSQLSAIHTVFEVEGQPMLCAQPVAVTHTLQRPQAQPTPAPAWPAPPPKPAAPAPQPQRAPGPAPRGSNPDLGDGTSAPILPLLARMLQQQEQQAAA